MNYKKLIIVSLLFLVVAGFCVNSVSAHYVKYSKSQGVKPYQSYNYMWSYGQGYTVDETYLKTGTQVKVWKNMFKTDKAITYKIYYKYKNKNKLKTVTQRSYKTNKVFKLPQGSRIYKVYSNYI
ncbi:MAG: hypothetical protein ACRC1M_08725 [Methanobacteriaceae archaeon]